MNESPKRPKNSHAAVMGEVAPYTSLGTQLTLTVLMMWGIGWWIDSTYNTKPLWTIILLAVGSVIGLVNFIRAVMQLTKRNEEKNAERRAEKKVASLNNNDLKG